MNFSMQHDIHYYYTRIRRHMLSGETQRFRSKRFDVRWIKWNTLISMLFDFWTIFPTFIHACRFKALRTMRLHRKRQIETAKLYWLFIYILSGKYTPMFSFNYSIYSGNRRWRQRLHSIISYIIFKHYYMHIYKFM
jgi:hypothetical protein